jgi:hypothetical protein
MATQLSGGVAAQLVVMHCELKLCGCDRIRPYVTAENKIHVLYVENYVAPITKSCSNGHPWVGQVGNNSSYMYCSLR